MGGVPEIINPAIFLKIDPRVSVLAQPELWHFQLTLLVVLTTLSLPCERVMTSRKLQYVLSIGIKIDDLG